MVRSTWIAFVLFCVAGTSTLSFGQTAPAGKKYAILVGVNEYKHERLPNLKYAERDVEDLAKLLGPAGYRVTLLTGSSKDPNHRADKENIERQIKDVLHRCDKGDIVLLAFAGHGVQFEGQPDAYFCPLDARPLKEKADSLVSLSGIYTELNSSFAGIKVLLVDACRNDPDQARGARSGIDADNAPRPPSGVAALFSCKAGERAFENEKLQHGIFFHHVLEALKGEAANKRGEVTFASMASHVSRSVSDDVPKLVGQGARQSPNLKADYATEPVLMLVKEGANLKAGSLDVERKSKQPETTNPVVIVDTSMGKFTIELFRDKAPNTVKNFLDYVDTRFYDGTIFHRVMPNFMIQGGGYEPGMKEKKAKAPIKNESNNGLSNVRGSVALARAANPDSGSAQFFINPVDNSHFLDKNTARDSVGYCVFGKVIEGMDVIDKIKGVSTGKRGNQSDVPVTDVVIRSIRRRE